MTRAPCWWAEIAVFGGIAVGACGWEARDENPFEATDPAGLDDGAPRDDDGASGTSGGTDDADGTGAEGDDDATDGGDTPLHDVGVPPSADDGGDDTGEGCQYVDVARASRRAGSAADAGAQPIVDA